MIRPIRHEEDITIQLPAGPKIRATVTLYKDDGIEITTSWGLLEHDPDLAGWMVGRMLEDDEDRMACEMEARRVEREQYR